MINVTLAKGIVKQYYNAIIVYKTYVNSVGNSQSMKLKY